MMEPTAQPAANQFDYVITLKSPGFKYINIVSQLLLLMFLLTYTFYLIRLGFYGNTLWLLVIPIFIIALWLYGWVRSSHKNFQVHYRLELMIAAMAWILLPLMEHSTWIGWGYALMAVIERWVKFPDEIGFSNFGAVRNAIPKKKYEWFEIDNVMIRDNLFTLDLRNNKIIQKELEEEISKDLEAEFNTYCKKHLHFTGQEAVEK